MQKLLIPALVFFAILLVASPISFQSLAVRGFGTTSTAHTLTVPPIVSKQEVPIQVTNLSASQTFFAIRERSFAGSIRKCSRPQLIRCKRATPDYYTGSGTVNEVFTSLNSVPSISSTSSGSSSVSFLLNTGDLGQTHALNLCR